MGSLNRRHAELIVADTVYLPFMADQPHDQEHYSSTFLVAMGLQDEIVRSDLTYVKWPLDRKSKAHPHTFSDLRSDPHLDELMGAIKEKTFLFARKFTRDCDLALFENTSSLFQSTAVATGSFCD